MSFRNLSPQHMFMALSEEHAPTNHFNGGDFESWKKETLPAALATLGDFPERVDPNPLKVAEWEQDGLLREKWLIDVSKHISATFLINHPPGGGKRPAILCCHGHGPLGKNPVMGDDASPDSKSQIEFYNYDYGRQMAQKGFVTFAIDWIGFGERCDGKKPNHHKQNAGRDWCNIYYLHATMLGMTSLSINVAHGRAAIDFASSFDDVDANAIGVMGLSGGGTMSLWMSLCDERIKATEIICYSDLWAHFGIRDVNYCGMQVAPGLFKLIDLPDAQGLIAPRPLLVDIGAHDECFLIDTAMACFNHVKEIYQAAGAEDKLELDLHPGHHQWGANKSLNFFNKHLKEQ